MGNNQSNPLNLEVNKILEHESPAMTESSQFSVLGGQPKEEEKGKQYVLTTTEAPPKESTALPTLIFPAAPTASSSPKEGVEKLSATSSDSVGKITDSPTSAQSSPRSPRSPRSARSVRSATSPVDSSFRRRAITLSPTSAQSSLRSATSPSNSYLGRNSFSATSPISPTRSEHQCKGNNCSGIHCTNCTPVTIVMTGEAMKVALEAALLTEPGDNLTTEMPHPKLRMRGGYTYAGEVSVEKSSEFNPNGFFNEMKMGGYSYESSSERNKQHKVNKKYNYEDDEDESLTDEQFSELTEGLDVDANEDTEQLKRKVLELRAMVSRSKGKKAPKVSRKSSSRRSSSRRSSSKRSSSAGGSEASVSEYLNSTSSISTSDVRLISMNKVRR
jgi:hypothetical protein